MSKGCPLGYLFNFTDWLMTETVALNISNFFSTFKGNNSKSRHTRVIIHIFCILPRNTLYSCSISWEYFGTVFTSPSTQKCDIGTDRWTYKVGNPNQGRRDIILANRYLCWCLTYLITIYNLSSTATQKEHQKWFQYQLSLKCTPKVLQNAPRGAFCNTFDLH